MPSPRDEAGPSLLGAAGKCADFSVEGLAYGLGTRLLTFEASLAAASQGRFPSI